MDEKKLIKGLADGSVFEKKIIRGHGAAGARENVFVLDPESTPSLDFSERRSLLRAESRTHAREKKSFSSQKQYDGRIGAWDWEEVGKGFFGVFSLLFRLPFILLWGAVVLLWALLPWAIGAGAVGGFGLLGDYISKHPAETAQFMTTPNPVLIQNEWVLAIVTGFIVLMFAVYLIKKIFAPNN